MIKKTSKELENLLYNAILAWYDDSMESFHGLDDEDFVNRVCGQTGMSEEDYRELVLEESNGEKEKEDTFLILSNNNEDAHYALHDVGREEEPDDEEENAGIVEGHTYRFAGYDWIAAEVKDGYAVLQSCGITSGPWPGYKMPQFGGEKNNWYDKDIDGQDISAYDSRMLRLYETIKSVEFTNAEYGKGLFLVSNKKVNQLERKDSDNYRGALKIAAKNYSSFGASYNNAWTGTYNGDVNAYYVHSNGDTYNYSQNHSFAVPAAFNLDQSKVRVEGHKIVII